MYIYVGECYNGAKETMCYNGGGSGGYSTVGIETGTNGGGATDIRLLNGNWNDFESLKSRIMVAGGGGGSSYISGYDGCNSIAESSTEENIIHTGNIIHYSGKYFLYTRMESGRNYMPSPSDTTTEVQGNSGNGYAKITKMKVENF